MGFNVPVIISTASAFLTQPSSITRRTITLMAHFDTGARLTTIVESLARHLQLIPIGSSQVSTANGNVETNNYAVDLGFIYPNMRAIPNLQISSCNLANFDISKALENPNDPTNFGLLIGRDIMANWHIAWFGPASTVIVSE
ncbi:retropepsin-like domain-containing protein [Candidatus Saganbacteria bacterium]|nr:retropepsin-like domain-containing protein [Candidatus Saganbacteria bacterium]